MANAPTGPKAPSSHKAVGKSAPKAKAIAPEPEPGNDPPDAATVVLRKKDLLDRVGALAQGKKKDVKQAVEATLLVLGEALARGEELNLPPLGKAKVGRQKGVPGGELYIIRLRRGPAKGETAAAPLADGEN